MRASIASFDLLLVLACAACGGSSVSNVTGPADSGGSHADSGTRVADSATDEGTGHAIGHDGSAGGGDSATGPRVYVRIGAVQTPLSGGGASQETPVDQRVGILGVTLLKDASDPSPLVAISLSTPLETPYNAGSSTLIGSAAASALVPGTYTLVRVPVAYVNFTVAGTLHYDGMAIPGDFHDLISLTAGTPIDGAARDRGWWSSSFSVGGMTYGATTGENSAIAQPGSASHIGLDLSGAVAAYVFPLTLTIPPSITHDMEIVFTANTYEDFHWQDESTAGYTDGVFDVSVGSYEPVTQLGANSATVSIGPVTTP